MVKGVEYLKEALEYAPSGILSEQGNELFLTETNNIAMTLRIGPGFLKTHLFNWAR